MTDDNVKVLGIFTTAPDVPENILDKAKKWGLSECIVIGHGPDYELQIGATTCDPAKLLLLLQRGVWFIQRSQGE